MKRSGVVAVVAVHVVAAAESIQGVIIGGAEQGVLGSGARNRIVSAFSEYQGADGRRTVGKPA